MQDGVDAAAKFLEGATIDERGRTATGRRRGRTVTFRSALRGAGSYSEWWTEIDTPCGDAPLRLALRPQTPQEEGLVARELAIDLPLGDPAFDSAFIVEAGPADVVRALLDADRRERLLALRPVGLVTVGGCLRLEKEGHLEAPEKIRAAVDLLLDLAEGVPDAVAAADDAARARAGYRDHPAQAAAIETVRAAEVAKVGAVQLAREEHHRRTALAILLGVFLLVAVEVVLAASGACGGTIDPNTLLP
jgi:hypothetical protein